MTEIIYTNEWTLASEHMPPLGREVLVRVERPTKKGSIEVLYGGVLRWNGYYWIDANTNTRVNEIVHKWYMFFRDTEGTQEY